MGKVRDLKWYQNRVKKLIEINKNCPIQKSPEWFAARNTKCTASEAASCLPRIKEVCEVYEKLFNTSFKYDQNKSLSSYDSRNEYIINKCRTFYGENLFKDNIYTLHGKKYEEISCRLYRKLYNTDVIEFGLLPHTRLKYLAASPDGITPNGIMLEIKNPNKMYHIPSPTYFCQMQLQMECADLDECDFLVCEVKELQSEQDYINKKIDESMYLDITNSCKQYKGIVLNKINELDNSINKYIYPPDNLNTTDEFINWSNKTIDEYKTENVIITPNYYVITNWTVLRIKREKEWFNSVKHYFKETLGLIKTLQNDPQLFEDYKESIFLIHNKEYLTKQANTVCLIDNNDDDDNDDEFIYDIDSDMETDLDINIESKLCLISDN